MKIIKATRTPPPEPPCSWQFTCISCKSILEAEPADVEYADWGAYCEKPVRRYYVPCPICGTDNFTSPITAEIRRLAHAYVETER